ncbi:dodecin domain-containing protein [Pigmentiphaga aceris]|uniref:Dodecin domain-containing protein n=1 Tax=Pigmentiphaga aceris TaxID=1940612 RepID=A0A5C0B279_9BURK|nr:dodecin [Pigmentiphaga aceris]QEI08014.1 dodecin domain-containing protein [Pigmentiphaga aceris]
MSDNVYKIIELTGESTQSVEHAVTTAVERAARTLDHIRWFEVIETRGSVQDGKVASWQVTLKLGVHLDDRKG